MMKTKIILLLTLISISFTQLAVYPASDNNNCEKEMQLLKLLNITNDNDSIQNDDYIMRAQFAIYICRMMQLEKARNYHINFVDVEKDFYAYDDIIAVVANGYMQGRTKDVFEPGSHILYAEALKVFVDALGYKLLAEEKGGYPFGYIVQAQELNLTKGITYSNESKVNFRDLVIMLHNVLNTEVLRVSSVGEKVVYNNNRLLLISQVFDVYRTKGIINFAGNISITKNSERVVYIDNNSYYVGDTNPIDLIGQRVTAYYRDKNNERELVYLFAESKINTITIDRNDISSYESGNLKYHENGKTKSIHVSPAADVLFNGVAISADQRSSIFNNSNGLWKDGYVECLSNDGSDDYTLFRIWAYENIVVYDTDEETNTIYAEYDNSKTIKMNDISVVHYCDDNGTPRLFKDIKKGMVLSIAKSLDNTYAKLYLSDKVLQGTIEERDLGNKEIVIDGISYSITNAYFEDAAAYNFHDTNKYLLDFRGKIARIVTFENAFHYGFLITAKKGDSLDIDTQFKIFGDDGVMHIFNGAKNLKIDGMPIDTESFASTLSKNALVGTMCQPIRYLLDKSGELKEIDTIAENFPNNENSMSLLYDSNGSALLYRRIPMSFYGKANITNDTKVFLIPKDLDEKNAEDLCFTATTSYFQTDMYYNIYAVRDKAEKFSADAIYIISNEQDGLGSSADFYVVKKRVKTLNDNGNTVDCLYAYTATSRVNNESIKLLTLDENVLNNVSAYKTGITRTFSIDVGDIVKLSKDPSGKTILGAKLVYDASEDTLYADNPTSSDYRAGYRMYVGNVYSKNKNLICVTTEALTDKDIKPNSFEIHDVSLGQIYRYTSKTKTFEEVNDNEIRDFVHCSNFTKLYIFTRSGDPAKFFIYE